MTAWELYGNNINFEMWVCICKLGDLGGGDFSLILICTKHRGKESWTGYEILIMCVGGSCYFIFMCSYCSDGG